MFDDVVTSLLCCETNEETQSAREAKRKIATGLFCDSTPMGEKFYYVKMRMITHHSEGVLDEGYACSPVIGGDYGRAQRIFKTVAHARAAVHPEHLNDIVYDLLQGLGKGKPKTVQRRGASLVAERPEN